jgi:hypothetical protein
VVVGRNDQKLAVTSTTSTSVEATTLPDATTVPAMEDTPLLPTETTVTVPDGAGTTAPAVPPTTASPPAAPSGVLLVSLDTLGLRTVDINAGTQNGELPLRNTGRAPLTYATRSSFAGLTVDKPTGTIGPGQSVTLAVTLDGSKAGEGPFTATLTVDGSGGTKQVNVAATVGRRPVIKDDAGEPCTTVAYSCSKAIQLVPVGNPDARPTLCNTPWRYSVTVEDESQLKAVQADANLAGRDADLKKDGSTRGSSGRWQSDVFPPLPVGAGLNVTIRAVDQFDFFSVRNEATIRC